MHILFLAWVARATDVVYNLSYPLPLSGAAYFDRRGSGDRATAMQFTALIV
jgi:hypothetical protein